MVAGDVVQAERLLREILDNNHQNYAALLGLACLNMKLGRLQTARKFIQQALKYYPDAYKLYELQGYSYAVESDLLASAAAYQKALKLYPDCVSIQHLLNGVQQKTTATAPIDYIRDLFDDYAEVFERDLLIALNYRSFADLAALITEVISPRSSIDSVLDLGCGTGLLGQALKDQFQIRHLVGVDLASNMLVKSRARNIYNTLYNAELLQHLQNSNDLYDVIGATDVLTYIGDLAATFAESYKSLNPGGFLGFTVESLDSGSFKLMPTGRYKHALSYLAALSSRSGFSKIWTKPIDLRKEYGNIVAGYLVLLQK